MRTRLTLLPLLLSSTALAQAPSPAQMGITQGTPQSLQVLDNGSPKTWVPLGAVSNGIFSGMGAEIALKSFGAKCDNSTDDTAAIQNWFNKATTRVKLVGMPGQCVFKNALVIPATDDLIVDFQGGVLHYTGPSTTINLLSIGQQASDCVAHRIGISNLTMYSDTTMTAGDAFVASEICVLSLDHVYFGHVWLPNNFYNGCHFVGGNQVYVKDYSCRGINAGEIDNGNDSAHGGAQSTDVYHFNGALSNSGIGLLIAGNCGGCYWDSIDVVNNTTNNVLIDQSQTPALPNRQIRFGPNFASDGTPGDGVRISDPGSASTCPGPGRCGNQIFCLNCWISTATHDCLVIDANVKWEIHLIGMRMENCQHNGITNASNNIHLIIDGGAIAQSTNVGVFNSATLPWVDMSNRPSMYGNGGGDISGLKPTISTGCGGSGAQVNGGDDYDYQIQWGTVAGQTTCTINYGGFHATSATVTTTGVVGTNTTANRVSGGGAVSQSFVTATALSSGNTVTVHNSGPGF